MANKVKEEDDEVAGIDNGDGDHNSGRTHNMLTHAQKCIEALHSHTKKLLKSKDKLKAEYESEIEQLQNEMHEQDEKLHFEQELSRDLQYEVIRLHHQVKEAEGLQEKLKTEQLHTEELQKEVDKLTVMMADLIQQHRTEQNQMEREIQNLQEKLNEEHKFGEDLKDKVQRLSTEKEDLDKWFKAAVDGMNREKETVCEAHAHELDQMQQEIEQLKMDAQMKTATEAASWKVPRTSVILLDKSLGEDAWWSTYEGMFRGLKVAVKSMRKTIHLQNLDIEFNAAAQVRHPNIVLFIAAVLDDQGGPLVINELLDMTLRKAYEDGTFGLDMQQCLSAFRDVAAALCYLHESTVPIIHRDVTSSNVLIEDKGNGRWSAKLSHSGCSNWVKHSITVADGSIVYTAPEAFPVNPSQPHKPQTTMIDVYSYGILLCEVLIGELPNVGDLPQAYKSMKLISESLYDLTERCTQLDPALRPTMGTIIQELNIRPESS